MIVLDIESDIYGSSAAVISNAFETSKEEAH